MMQPSRTNRLVLDQASEAPFAELSMILSKSPLFAGIPERQCQLIISEGTRREIKGRESIIRSGEKASHLFLLQTGRVKYFRITKSGQELVLWWLSDGDAFGISSLLTDAPEYLGNAEAITACQILSWPRSSIRQLARAYPRLSENALGIALHYLAVYAKRHEALITQTAAQRLAHTLVDVAHRTGHPRDGHVEVEITNEQLGKLADVGLFTATRLLSAWEKLGVLQKRRGKVCIEAPEKLPLD